MYIRNILMLFITFSLFLGIITSQIVYSQDFDCDFTQITNTLGGETRDVRTNSDGSILVFVSDQDLTGSNADGNLEIFLYDVDSSMFTQVTDTLGFNNVSPTMNFDGSLVVFASANDITGDNADTNAELFLLETDTITITQLTNTTGGGTSFSGRFPIISSNGTHAVFVSNRDYIGNNPDGNVEVFLIDINALTFTQITETTGTDHNLIAGISSDGTITSFNSEADLTGDNADLSQELFIYNALTDTISQITDSSGSTAFSNRRPSVSPDGSLIAFESDLNLTGDNADGNLEIFLFDIVADSILQITNTDSVNRNPTFSSDGNIIIFSSTGDFTGNNPDGNLELFFYEIDEDNFLQVTDSTGGFGFGTAFNSDLTFLATPHNTDLTGDNPDENTEVFISECIAIAQSSSGGGSGCSLAQSVSGIADLSLLMLFPALVFLRRLKRKQ